MKEITEAEHNYKESKKEKKADSKVKKIAVIALIFSFIAIGGASGIQYLENMYCLNCTLDNPTFVNYTFPGSINGTNVNITNMTYIGEEYTSIVEVQDTSAVMKVIDGTTTGLYVTASDIDTRIQGISKFDVTNEYVFVSSLDNINNSHVCAGEEGRLNINCAVVSDNTKVNKSGDTMTGNLNMTGHEVNNLAYTRFNNSSINGMYWAGGSRLYEQSTTYGSSTNRMIYQPNGDMLDVLNEAGSQYIVRFGGVNAAYPNRTIFYRGVSIGGGNDTQANIAPPSNGLVVWGNVSIKGNVGIQTYGKGIQLVSPDGTRTACITLSNLGILTTTGGVCT